MQLDGWTWEDMTLQGGVGMHITWPRMRADRSLVDRGIERRSKSRIAIARSRHCAKRSPMPGPIAPAKQAHADGKAPIRDHDAALGSDDPGAGGQDAVFIEAEDIRQIQAAVAFAEQEG